MRVLAGVFARHVFAVLTPLVLTVLRHGVAGASEATGFGPRPLEPVCVVSYG